MSRDVYTVLVPESGSSTYFFPSKLSFLMFGLTNILERQ